MKAVFTGGGTGGHIYPALAVARNFIDKYDCQIKYIGSSEGMEKGIVEDEGIDFLGIETDGFRSKNPFVNLGVLLKLRKAVKKLKHILKDQERYFVFAPGGMFPPLLYLQQVNWGYLCFFMNKTQYLVLLTS
jgi:UDP-N-acetylglucosamine--N-acetylmuramyl-(pentapeptide) pyrophosphoryl-undecaprenol N-acetylglucosamine transferase